MRARTQWAFRVATAATALLLSLPVYLYPKSAYATQLNGLYPPHVRDEHRRKLHNLGSGAVYVTSNSYNIDDVLRVSRR